MIELLTFAINISWSNVEVELNVSILLLYSSLKDEINIKNTKNIY